MINWKLYFFFSALVLPKAKFKLLRFSDYYFLKKWKNIVTTFWKSIARDSNNLSSTLLVWTSSMWKIKNRTLLLFFIRNFLTSWFWFSFTNHDILMNQYKDVFSMWKKISEVSVLLKKSVEIIATNKIVNKIFWDFFFAPFNLCKNSIFFEKYFLKEWSSWTITLSKTLKYFMIWFFSFYIPDFLLLKKNYLLLEKQNLSNYTSKTLSFIDIFKNKRFFLFPNSKENLTSWLNFVIEIVQILNIFDFIFFYDGYLVLKGTQKLFLFRYFSSTSSNSDSSFLNFFFKSDWSFLLTTTDVTIKNVTKKIDKTFFVLNQFILNNLFTVNFVFLWVIFFLMFWKFLFYKLNIFIFLNTSIQLFTIWCRLLDNY